MNDFLDYVLKNAQEGGNNRGSKTKEFIKDASIDDLINDFKKASLKNVKSINTPWGEGKVGTFPDECNVIYRPGSSRRLDKAATLEIQKSKFDIVKIRYIKK